MASEFNYLKRFSNPSIGIGITQSGETADTLKALRRLKETGTHIIAITNIVASTASKIANKTIYTRAGPEISVAATKSFISQLIALYWMFLSISGIDNLRFKKLTTGLRQLPDQTQRILDNEDQFAKAAENLATYSNVFYIGRGLNYAIALEGALKLKEVSYIHCEACAAGEMKHGTFAILDKNIPVIAIVAEDNKRDAMITTLREIKARGSPLIVIAPEDNQDIANLADTFLPVPSVTDIFSPFVNTIAIQLLAYYTARKRGCPIDFPRNLAKCVTVE
jgi:glucosamine--fructose-6-phosphate aminotransferase (isomerizing)